VNDTAIPARLLGAFHRYDQLPQIERRASITFGWLSFVYVVVTLLFAVVGHKITAYSWFISVFLLLIVWPYMRYRRNVMTENFNAEREEIEQAFLDANLQIFYDDDFKAWVAVPSSDFTTETI